jgi:hypothetical protein
MNHPLVGVSSVFRLLSSAGLRRLALSVGFALAVVTLLLVTQNTRFRKGIKFYQDGLHTPENVVLPSLRGKDLQGREITVAYVAYEEKGIETLVFVFSPLCGYCRQTWRAWLDLAKGCSDKRIVFANISGRVTTSFLQDYPVPQGLVLANVDPATILAYDFRETPVTVLMDSRGKSKRVWSGVVAGSLREQIQRAARVNDFETLRDVI